MAKTMKLDFTDVQDRSDFRIKHLPEGDYLARIEGVDDHKSKEGNTGWVWTIGILGTEGQNATLPYYTMFAANQLWKIRNLIEAAGMKVPKKVVKVDPTRLVGKELGVSLVDDEYEGKMKSAIDDVLHPEGAALMNAEPEPGAEYDEVEDEVDEDEIEVDDEEVVEVDEDELEELDLEEIG